ncbi:MAG: MFS transporter, partial [Pseudomonadota bacterium]|nr:MFS transporter [Pseudomonadota bacterium]
MPIKRPSKTVVFVGMATAFSLLGDQALYAVLPVYFEELGLAPIEVGLILSVNRWIRLITNDFAHRMSGRFRSDLLFTCALLLGSLTTAMYVFTSL